MQDKPIVNKEYSCFDDGKIHKGRLYTVKVEELIPFADIDIDTLELWVREAKICHWLYAKETDFFAICRYGEDNKKEVFVRTVDGGWFGIGGFFNCGRLDIDGNLKASLHT